ncbi:MAG TPA: hypothetical protein VKU41_03500, partial [Polyangiaceae bacterium]|nr:hypothetical protein [Polyangiaceae bacterium]
PKSIDNLGALKTKRGRHNHHTGSIVVCGQAGAGAGASVSRRGPAVDRGGDESQDKEMIASPSSEG